MVLKNHLFSYYKSFVFLYFCCIITFFYIEWRAAPGLNYVRIIKLTFGIKKFLKELLRKKTLSRRGKSL